MKTASSLVLENLQEVEGTTTIEEEHRFLKMHIKDISLYSLEVEVSDERQPNNITPEAYQKLLTQISKVYNRIEEIEQMPYFQVIARTNSLFPVITTCKGL